jgi:hypothetical protein
VVQDGFELAAPQSVLLGKLSADLARHSSQDLISSAGENLIAEDSLQFLDFRDIGHQERKTPGPHLPIV